MSQHILSDNNAYDVSLPRPFPFMVSAGLTMQHTLYQPDSTAIKIVTDFNSDKCEWTYLIDDGMGGLIPGKTKRGDCKPQNLGSIKDDRTHSPTLRFESANDQLETTHVLRLDGSENYPNGFFPDVIYIGNHNLDWLEDEIKFVAYQDEDRLFKLYEFDIDMNTKEIFAINSFPIMKTKYYDLVITTAQPKDISIGRIVLGTSLPTTFMNNMLKDYSFGYNDYVEEIITEAKSRLFNRKGYVKKFNFSIRVNLEKDKKLIKELEELINKGNGNQPFIVIPDPTDNSWLCTYGILLEMPSFTHNMDTDGTYNFNVEGIE